MRTFLLILLALLAGCAPRPDSPASAAEADRALVAAINSGDELSALELIDDDVTWTDRRGRTLTKPQLEDMWPAPAIAGETSAEAHAFDYARVTVVRIDRGRLHTLRVWAQRPVGWRLLVYQEVESLASAPAAAPPGVGQECVNPCKKIPYEPKTGNERGVIAAYQALETAAHAADVDNWGRYVADEFVVVSSNSDRVLTKDARLEGLRQAAYRRRVAEPACVNAAARLRHGRGDAVAAQARERQSAADCACLDPEEWRLAVDPQLPDGDYRDRLRAIANALPNSTPARWRLYSTEPRVSGKRIRCVAYELLRLGEQIR